MKDDSDNDSGYDENFDSDTEKPVKQIVAPKPIMKANPNIVKNPLKLKAAKDANSSISDIVVNKNPY